MEISNEEKYYISFIKDTIAKNTNLNIFDVGCNKGFYTDNLLKTFSDANYYLFDTSERFISLVEGRFKDLNNVKTFNIAISDTDNEYVDFYELKSENDDVEGMSSLTKRNVFSKYVYDVKKINTGKLDTFIIDNQIDHIDFIKIDTEGQELKILVGLRESIKNGIVDFIQIEYGDCSIENGFSLIDVLTFIDGLDYTLFFYVNNGLIEINNDNYNIYTNLSWANFLIKRNGI